MALNQQPATLVCEYGTAGSHLVGSTTLQVSNDGTHFGVAQDAGLTIYFNQDTSATTTLAISLAPVDPYVDAEIVTNITINDGGTAGNGTVNCQLGVIQAQNIHLVHPKKK
jgi:hypothetical protein